MAGPDLALGEHNPTKDPATTRNTPGKPASSENASGPSEDQLKLYEKHVGATESQYRGHMISLGVWHFESRCDKRNDQTKEGIGNRQELFVDMALRASDVIEEHVRMLKEMLREGTLVRDIDLPSYNK